MKKISLALFSIFLLCSFSAKGPTFSLVDSQVEIGAIYTLQANFDAYSQDLNTKLETELDDVAKFLSNNSKLKVEIGVHSVKSGTEIMTAERANTIMNYLSKKGARRNKITAVGYADKSPIITQRELFKLQTFEEKMNAKDKNERVEIKILENE